MSRKTVFEACPEEVVGLVCVLLWLLLLVAEWDVEAEDVPNNLDLIVLL